MMMMMMKHFTVSLLVVLFHFDTICGQPASAPAPAGPTNITKILEKAGEFTILIKLMKTTAVANQIDSQLNNSNNALTIFAPTDNAFATLPSGTLNSLTNQQQVELIQFHVIPTFLSAAQFQTVSNPLRTQAGGSGAYEFPMNVTTSGNQVNVSTGVNNATVDNTIYSDNQLAVYQVDKVLLPMSIFGDKPPAPSPAPSSSNKSDSTSSPEGDSATVDASPSGCRGRLNGNWLAIIGAAAFIGKTYMG